MQVVSWIDKYPTGNKSNFIEKRRSRLDSVGRASGSQTNPGNLTSVTVCGDRTGCAPAAKRSTSVAQEVDLGECTLCSPLQCE